MGGLMDSRCANRVAMGGVLGGSLGGAVGAMYGTYEAFRYKVPGIYKLRYIGQTTVQSAGVRRPSSPPSPPRAP